MRHLIQYTIDSQLGEWSFPTGSRAKRAFSILKRRMTRLTARDGKVRTVAMLAEVETAVAQPANRSEHDAVATPTHADPFE